MIPTKDRPELLKQALLSVQSQDFKDWEIVVSDNGTGPATGEYVASLKDPRILYFKTPRSLSVTDNWNQALAMSLGDYVVMLGDDDALCPGYFSRMRSLIEKFQHPDFLYTKAYQFIYPGVMAAFPEGYLQECGAAPFFHGRKEPFLLEKAKAQPLVQDTLEFRLSFEYNMQYALVKRELIESIERKDRFFQSLFPDYYAMNLLFYFSEKTVIVPEPLVIIGVANRSYGYFHHNNDEEAGISFLNASKQVPGLVGGYRFLPGSYINTGWLDASIAIKQKLEVDSLRIDYGKYRRLQYLALLERSLKSHGSREKIKKDLMEFSVWERVFFYPLRCFLGLILRGGFRGPKAFMDHKVSGLVAFLKLKLPFLYQFPESHGYKVRGQYQCITEVFEGLKGKTHA